MSEYTADTLTPRELDVLRLIGQGLSNHVIAEKLVISLGTARWYSKQIYGKLGVHSRAEEIVRAGKLGLLERPGAPEERARTPLTLTPARTNLPAPPMPLIGRQAEIAAIQALLAESRFVTLTGPAGVGKTRLAIQVAAEQASQYTHGAFFLELTPVTNPALVASTIASTLGIKEVSGQPMLDTLKAHLQTRHLLLVLDNFEQVIGAAPLVGELLAAAPRLHVIVTSREVLRVYGEHEYTVPPLALPDRDGDSTADALARYDAVVLFVQRARAARHDFELTDDNAPAVAEICTQLDGLPLAIELAAARARLFAPGALLARLGNRLDMLTASARDVPERQRTLRGAIEWSYNLLKPAEKTLFARLSVFVGGRSIEAAEVVCDPDLPIDVIDGLESLLNKSLLWQEEDPTGEPRFLMLDTIHEYARERLADSGEAESIRRRHAGYFLTLAERAAEELRGPDDQRWLTRLEAEHDNLRAALDWLLEHGEAEAAVRLAGALGHFWYMQGHHTEGRAWSEQAIARLDAVPEPYHARLLVSASHLAFAEGDLDYGRIWAEEALAVSRKLGDQLNTAWSLTYLGGNSVGMPDDYEDAIDACQEGLAIFRALGYTRGVAQALNILGEVTRLHGDYRQAEAYYQECLALSRETGELLRVSMMYENLSFCAYHNGDYAQAEAYARDGLELYIELDSLWGVSCGFAALVGPLAAQGDPQRAARLLGAAESLLDWLDTIFQPGDQPEIDRYVEVVRAQLDPDTFEAARAEGLAMSVDEALEDALGGDS